MASSEPQRDYAGQAKGIVAKIGTAIGKIIKGISAQIAKFRNRNSGSSS